MTNRVNVVSCCVLIGAWFAAGCNKQPDAQPDKAQPSANESRKTVEAAPAAPGSAEIRCSDFFTDADVSALALKPMSINHEIAIASEQAVRCSYKAVSAYIWRGDRFPSIVDGVKTNGKSTGVETEEGPAVGAQTLWTTMPAVHGADGKAPHTLNFSPSNKKFTGAVTGTDKDRVQQVATALLARFEKM